MKQVNYKIDSAGDWTPDNTENKRTKKKNTSNKSFDFNVLNLGFYLAAPLLGGVFIGSWLDKKLHSQPIFVLAGIIIGAIASFYNLFRLLKTNAKH